MKHTEVYLRSFISCLHCHIQVLQISAQAGEYLGLAPIAHDGWHMMGDLTQAVVDDAGHDPQSGHKFCKVHLLFPILVHRVEEIRQFVRVFSTLERHNTSNSSRVNIRVGNM
ncbi:hypothetical protein NQD34_013705 [Periophthalmus magnuspinnatus]|nr:hypothetical protein NQD34_013705 [Periophthalmus magnuspinnatus]